MNGVWCFNGNTNEACVLAGAGFDWICFDAQHGEFDRPQLIETMRSLRSPAASVAVRVPSVDSAWIGFALDVGAATVIVPLVESADEALRAVRASKYPPLGRRSWGQFAPLWGGDVVEPADIQSRSCCALMIESDEGLANVEEIAAVPGADMLFVGPFDLALSLGTTVDSLLADDFDGSPLTRIADAANRNGLRLGAFAGDLKRAERFRERGFSFVAIATDRSLLAAGIRSVIG